MNEPHDPNVTADIPSVPADSLGTTDHVRGSASTAASHPGAGARPGDLPVVPGYRVLREIARGGMGRVLAAVELGLDRDVALKVLLPGANADRFVRESKITARLPHPGIPPVHALGTLADGSPFLAMKLVAGQTLADEMKTADRPRLLQAFRQVCQAVGFAHSRDVVHRDLKPANVMVGAFGEVQVMDWGLAKELQIADWGLQIEETAETEVLTTSSSNLQSEICNLQSDETQAGTVLGTPAYMAPEQARGETADAHADVFALGGILCAILTGQPPFVGQSNLEVVRRAGTADLAEAHTRLNRSAADADLIALCRRCLSASPADRPANGLAVADGMTAHLHGVQDRLQAAERERAVAVAREAEQRKRRRVWLGAAAALTVAIIAGLGAVLAVQRQANADLAEKNQLLAAEQVKVENRFEMARKAIETFHTGVSEDALLKNEQLKELRTKFLRQAAGFYQELEKLLAEEPDAKSRKALAAGYFQLGELTAHVGDKQAALAVHRKGLAVRRELAAAPGADTETRLDVARSLRQVGVLMHATGDPAGALRTHEEQRDLAALLEAEFSTNAVRELLAGGHHNIGNLLWEKGKPTEALAAYREALAIQQRLADANPAVTHFQSELARSLNSFGIVLRQTGKPAAALVPFQQARDIRQKLADANPSVGTLLTDLAASHESIAIVLLETGKPMEALAPHEEARDIRQKLADAYPAVTQFRRDLAISHFNIGVLLLQLGKWGEALAPFQQARDVLQKLSDANPSVIQFLNYLASCHECMGIALSKTGQPVEALAAYEKALAVGKKLSDAHPKVPDYQRSLGRNYSNLGWLLARHGRYTEAFVALDMAVNIHQKLVEAHPTTSEYSRGLGYGHAYRGWTRVRVGQPEGATDLRRAVNLWAKDPAPSIETRFETTRALALLVKLGADVKSGVTADEAKAFADRAVAALADAVKFGWALPSELKEPDFDALRGRPDFQKLVAEVEAKSEPKAKE